MRRLRLRCHPRRRQVRPDRRALVQGVGRQRHEQQSPLQHLCSVLPTCVPAQAMPKPRLSLWTASQQRVGQPGSADTRA